MARLACFRPQLLSVLLVLCTSTALPAQAFHNNFSDLFIGDEKQKDGGKGRAAVKAQSQYGGKVLSVRETKGGGQPVYKVKLLLDSGRIKIVTIKGD